MPVTPLTYDIRLGPLLFTWPRDTVTETLGDTLEAVGAALTPAERRPRPIKLPLRIEGANSETDPRVVGYRYRRQIRQLLENPLWLAQGLYFWWRADPELSGWLRVGGGDFEETDPGVSFGIWDLNLDSAYIVGRPATHRTGRRLDLADRRTGLVPRDTRGTLYSTDFSSVALPASPFIVPGDTFNHLLSNNRPLPALSAPVARAGRNLPRSLAGGDGDVLSYLATLTPEAEAYVTLDDLGAVRVWDLTNAVPNPPTQASYTTAGDADPTVYGWERVYGSPLQGSQSRVAMDNGLIRLVWLGNTIADGLAYEWYDTTLAGGTFRREGRLNAFTSSAAGNEVNIVELTPERGVIEWRAGPIAMRAILQRGWNHVRLESYNASGSAAALYYNSVVGAVVAATTTPAWVRTLTAGGRVQYWAQGISGDVFTTAVAAFGAGGIAWSAGGTPTTKTIVAQLGSPQSSAVDVSSWSLVDAQSVPVLLRRSSS